MRKLSVIFVTQDDPIYVGTFWSEFSKFSTELTENGIEVKKIVVLQPLGKRSKVQLIKHLLNFYGPLDTFKLGLRFLKSKLAENPIISASKNLGTEVLYVQSVNTDDFIQQARETDIVFSVAASEIFRSGLLNAPKYGCFNIHSGPLPNYKGMMPVFWQMLNGEKRIGITIHRMVEKLDAGEIVLQEFVDISDIRSLDKAIRFAKKHAASMVKRFLLTCDEILASSEPKKKISQKGTYFSFPNREHAKLFRKKGYKMI